MKVFCISCLNDWLARGGKVPRQCPTCWSRAIATEDDLRLGSFVCHLLANLAAGLPPPAPGSPPSALADAISLPFSMKAYHDVISRADDQAERRRAVILMLQQRGLPVAQCQNLALSMFP